MLIGVYNVGYGLEFSHHLLMVGPILRCSPRLNRFAHHKIDFHTFPLFERKTKQGSMFLEKLNVLSAFCSVPIVGILFGVLVTFLIYIQGKLMIIDRF